MKEKDVELPTYSEAAEGTDNNFAEIEEELEV